MAETLDPEDWAEMRRVLHAAVDDVVDHMAGLRERPVWRPMPPAVRTLPEEPLPTAGMPIADVLATVRDVMLPHATGNAHPRFFGWVHGSGNAAGVLGELLAAAMNCNNGGRDHVGIYVERAVLAWCRTIFGFPAEATGVLTTGTSMANLLALRTALVAARARHPQAPLDAFTAYASTEAHSCILKAMRVIGFADTSLRLVPVDRDFRAIPSALAALIDGDTAAGLIPFCAVATAGTVNTAAIDPLAALRHVTAERGLWLHVDGAFGAMAVLSTSHRASIEPVADADSLSFDFHKWLHVPYDAGCVLVRDGAAHRDAFALRPSYLETQGSGPAGGSPWFCDYGLELSRGLRALKVWTTIKAHGTDRLGRQIQKNIDQAQRLAALVDASDELELAAPCSLNIVCLRYVAAGRVGDTDAIVARLYDSGVAVPSTTVIGGNKVIRVNITNHRTEDADLELLVLAVVEAGRALSVTRAPD